MPFPVLAALVSIAGANIPYRSKFSRAAITTPDEVA